MTNEKPMAVVVEKVSSGFYRITPADPDAVVVYARRPVMGTNWQAGRDLGRRDLVWDGPFGGSLAAIVQAVENGTIEFSEEAE